MAGNVPDGPFAQPQELVMTLLGSYVHPRRQASVWSGGLTTLLTELGFSSGAARVALTRLANRGLLARHKHGRQVHYTITERAAALLDDGDERIFSLGRGERAACWTVLWHSIPEQRRIARERLVRRLRFLGFGTVGDGTWLAPHNLEREVTELLSDLGVTDYAGLMLGNPAASIGIRPLIARAWNLDELAEQYAAFVTEFAPYTQDRMPAALGDQAAFTVRTRLVHAFRQFPFADPELPPELVEPPQGRAEALRLFDELYAATAERAQRHFDSIAGRVAHA